MLRNYTAKYTKIPSGYFGQLVEWPEVVTEGRDIEDCRNMLRDALKEMMLAYLELKKEFPCKGCYRSGSNRYSNPFTLIS